MLPSVPNVFLQMSHSKSLGECFCCKWLFNRELIKNLLSQTLHLRENKFIYFKFIKIGVENAGRHSLEYIGIHVVSQMVTNV